MPRDILISKDWWCAPADVWQLSITFAAAACACQRSVRHKKLADCNRETSDVIVTDLGDYCITCIESRNHLTYLQLGLSSTAARGVPGIPEILPIQVAAAGGYCLHGQAALQFQCIIVNKFVNWHVCREKSAMFCRCPHLLRHISVERVICSFVCQQSRTHETLWTVSLLVDVANVQWECNGTGHTQGDKWRLWHGICFAYHTRHMHIHHNSVCNIQIANVFT